MKVAAGGHIHLMGICGTAMASLAGLLKNQGFHVTGSDQNVYPPMSLQLQKLGIPIMEGYRKENLEPRPDLVVVGNVITRQHEEAQALLASDIPYTSFPKALAEFVIADRSSIVITGTHGKTTTTSLMAWVADQCATNAGYLVGGIPKNFGLSFREPGNSDYFVIEGDEYDTAFFDKVPKFIHYKPRYVILTSIEFDHADIYQSLDEILASFRQLIRLIPKEGLLVAHAEDPNIRALLPEASCPVVTYGVQQGDYRVNAEVLDSGLSRLRFKQQEQQKSELNWSHYGSYNALNALSVYALCDQLGWTTDQVVGAIESFEGVKRRQEIIGEPRGITLIEDFAHHPTAVGLTIRSVQQRFSQRRLWAVFEPRSATSRRSIFQEDYAQALKGSHHVLIAPAFDQSRIPEAERFSATKLVARLQELDTDAHTVKETSDVIAFLKEHTKPGDVVLLMSNGGFGGIYPELVKNLAES